MNLKHIGIIYWDAYSLKAHDEKLEPHGQYLESVSMHDDLQYGSQRLIFRIRHRAGNGISRYCSGFARLYAPDSGTSQTAILDVAATQFEDGSAYHQYQPLTKKGNCAVGSNFNDDPLWLILGSQRLSEGNRRLGNFEQAGAL